MVDLTQEMVTRPADAVVGPARRRDKASWLIDLTVDDDHHACVDLHEDPQIESASWQSCDVYVKRSLDHSVLAPEYRSKVQPFGLVHDVAMSLDRYELQRLARVDAPFRERAVSVGRWFKRPIARAFGRDNPLDISACMSPPQSADLNSVFFLSRLYDPSVSRGDADREHDYHAMNDMRANCIRALRKEFGPRFFGGVEPSDYARLHYPDVLAERPEILRPSQYSALVRQHAICVATSGPLGCPNFTLAQYAALSRAIVAERLRVELPGEFAAGRNYLAFSSPDECVEQVSVLMSDTDRVHRQMQANWLYYNTWVRADALALRIINMARSASVAAPTLSQA